MIWKNDPMKRHSLLSLFLPLTLLTVVPIVAAPAVLPHPILFVTQTPQPSDFTSITALFGNHRGSLDSAPRGGALWIRYPDGTLRNLTAAAGYGHDGPQHGDGIAVREPTDRHLLFHVLT